MGQHALQGRRNPSVLFRNLKHRVQGDLHNPPLETPNGHLHPNSDHTTKDCTATADLISSADSARSGFTQEPILRLGIKGFSTTSSNVPDQAAKPTEAEKSKHLYPFQVQLSISRSSGTSTESCKDDQLLFRSSQLASLQFPSSISDCQSVVELDQQFEIASSKMMIHDVLAGRSKFRMPKALGLELCFTPLSFADFEDILPLMFKKDKIPQNGSFKATLPSLLLTECTRVSLQYVVGDSSWSTGLAVVVSTTWSTASRSQLQLYKAVQTPRRSCADIRVKYIFSTGDSNSAKNVTLTGHGFVCPFCDMKNLGSLHSLRHHLKRQHQALSFIQEETAENGVHFFVKPVQEETEQLSRLDTGSGSLPSTRDSPRQLRSGCQTWVDDGTWRSAEDTKNKISPQKRRKLFHEVTLSRTASLLHSSLSKDTTVVANAGHSAEVTANKASSNHRAATSKKKETSVRSATRSNTVGRDRSGKFLPQDSPIIDSVEPLAPETPLTNKAAKERANLVSPTKTCQPLTSSASNGAANGLSKDKENVAERSKAHDMLVAALENVVQKRVNTKLSNGAAGVVHKSSITSSGQDDMRHNVFGSKNKNTADNSPSTRKAIASTTSMVTSKLNGTQVLKHQDSSGPNAKHPPFYTAFSSPAPASSSKPLENGRINNKPRSTTKDTEPQRPAETEATFVPRKFPGLAELIRTTSKLPKSSRPKLPVPAAPKTVRLFRTATRRQFIEGELVNESDDEIDEGYVTRRHEETIDSHEDLTTAEKAFMKCWDIHFREEQLTGNKHMPAAIARFIISNKQLHRNKEMGAEFRLKLATLYEAGILSSLDLECCFAIFEREEKRGRVMSDRGSATQIPPSEKQKPTPLAPTCCCGVVVGPADMSIALCCASLTCDNPDYHLACVDLEERPQTWYCPPCARIRNNQS